MYSTPSIHPVLEELGEQPSLALVPAPRLSPTLILQIDQALQCSHHALKLILSVLQVQVRPDLGVLARKPRHLVSLLLANTQHRRHAATHIQVVEYPRIDLPWKLVEELLEQLDVDEHRAGVCQLVRNDGQESLGTECRLVGAGSAPFAPDRL